MSLEPTDENSQFNERDNALLDAALEVFGQIGIRRTTVDDIAQRAGVGRGTLYRRIGNKNDIVNAVLVRESRGLFRSIRAVADKSDSFTERVVASFATTVHTLRTNPVWNRLLDIETDEILTQLTLNGGAILTGAVLATAEVLRGPDKPAISDADLLSRAEILVRVTHSILLTPSVLAPLSTYEEIETFARRHLLPIASSPS